MAKTEERKYQGRFIETLMRNNAKIREDRAATIVESAQLLYRREIEDTELKIKQLIRERESLLDLSPENATSLILKADFDEKAFVDKDIKIGVQIRNLEIMLEIARERYQILFGA